MINNLSGRLRPHFFDVCKPDWSKINCTNSYGQPVFITGDVCTGTDYKKLREARYVTRIIIKGEVMLDHSDSHRNCFYCFRNPYTPHLNSEKVISVTWVCKGEGFQGHSHEICTIAKKSVFSIFFLLLTICSLSE